MGMKRYSDAQVYTAITMHRAGIKGKIIARITGMNYNTILNVANYANRRGNMGHDSVAVGIMEEFWRNHIRTNGRSQDVDVVDAN